MVKNKSYSELITIPGFLDRVRYLKLEGHVGFESSEVYRWLHQKFYHTPEWKQLRNQIVVRDCGFDLAHPDRPIIGRVLIHHINQITKQDILDRSYKLFDPENLISVSHITHNAIHYGDENLLPEDFTERSPNDTCPWK